MRLSIACAAFVRCQCGCANGLPVNTHDKPEYRFVIKELNVNGHVSLDPALLSQDIAVGKVGTAQYRPTVPRVAHCSIGRTGRPIQSVIGQVDRPPAGM